MWPLLTVVISQIQCEHLNVHCFLVQNVFKLKDKIEKNKAIS